MNYNYLYLIATFGIILCVTDIKSSIVWPCTTDSNCTIVDTATCAPSGNCRCPAGYTFTSDYTRCITESLYGDACEDTAQCSHMLPGAKCENAKCECVNGLKYLRGKCRALVDLDSACDEDINCSFGGDRESVACINNVCSCAEGFYRRTENVCRRISLDVGGPCIVNTDCQSENLICDQTNNECIEIVKSVGVQTDEEFIVNKGAIKKLRSINKKVSISRDEVEIINDDEDAKFGDNCDIESDQCVGLPFSVCREGLCVCKEGYYAHRNTKMCMAEFGEVAESSRTCLEGASVELNEETKKCVCRPNYFVNPNLRTCVKPSKGHNTACTQDTQCTPYGLSYCDLTLLLKVCVCHDYAEYAEDSQLCVSKKGLNQFCTKTEDCELSNTVCSEKNSCVCDPNYITVENNCKPGIGAACAETTDCGFENSECVSDVPTAEENKKCQCTSGLVFVKDECIEEKTFDEECIDTEQCVPLLGDQSACEENKCTCKPGTHFKNGKCNEIKTLGEVCKSSNQCFAEENSERVECRNMVCNCEIGYTKDVEKQICIRPASKPNASSRPSPLKVITIILMTSAALITSAAIREAYFLR